ncbi:MAG: outer membrane beta-barrel protein [Sphingomicrobium sp.]
MKKYLISAAVVAGAFAATPALADAPQGPRVELVGGLDILRGRIPGIGQVTHLEDGGYLYGIGAGWDFAFTPTISAGLDIEASGSSARLRKDYVNAIDYCGDGCMADVHYRAKPGLDAYIGGRLSFALTDVANAYLKAGYSRLSYRETTFFTDTDTGAAIPFANVNPSAKANLFVNDFSNYNRHRNLRGWRVGAGAQTQLFGNAYVGAEAAYTDYNHDVSRIRVAMTLGYRFFHPVVVVPPVYVAPPPPPPAPPPATQTCADGSVILATDMCPPPPPPPPPPAPAPGERG